MPESSLRVPFTLVLFGAAVWTFGIAYWRPHWLNQNRLVRLLAAMLEGLVCAAIWSAISLLQDGRLTGASLFDGILAGLAWTIVAFYSRSRYKKSLQSAAGKGYRPEFLLKSDVSS